MFGSQLMNVFQINSDGFQVLGLLPFRHPLSLNITWALIMRSFKREQRSIWRTCKRKTAFLRRAEVRGFLKWRWSWNHGDLFCIGMIILFFSLKVLNWGRRSHNLDGEMVWWISSLSCFLVMSSCLFLAAQPSVASIEMSFLQCHFLNYGFAPV